MNWKLVNFCEIDKYAVTSYTAIHGTDPSLNLGDITKVNADELSDFDLMTWGFPCTDISVAGKQKGFVDENGEITRSGLYFEGLRILRAKRPKLSLIENVKNLVGRFKKEFSQILKDLRECGYNNYWKVLDAKDYGIPQHRERVYILSVRKDVDNGLFEFPEPFPCLWKLTELLDLNVPEKYYIPDDKVAKIVAPALEKLRKKGAVLNELQRIGHINGSNADANRVYLPGIARTIKAEAGGGGAKTGLYLVPVDKSVNFPEFREYANCIEAREDRGVSNRKQEGTAVAELFFPVNTETVGARVRKLTPGEVFRIMGFTDEDYKACKEAGISETQLYKQAGNSIVVDVLFHIFLSLYYAMPYLFEDMKVLSLFSGIGAFERALDITYTCINDGSIFSMRDMYGDKVPF